MASYEGLAQISDKLGMVLREQEFKHMDQMNELTAKTIGEEHLANIEANIKNGLWDKHGPMSYGLHNIAKDKAIIGIGAGPSFNRNSAVLKQVHDFNFLKDLDDQPFLFSCSNHQWKNCMKSGVYPHFVIIVDAGEVLMPQLCDNVPREADGTILLTGLHCSPKVLEEWDRQGRPIQFYVPNFEKKQEHFKNITKEDPEKFLCEEGGNVLNMMWIISRKFMGSNVFLAVGNDCSFPIEYDPAKRRKLFYADGDYTSNIKNKKDEARHKKTWMGFEIEYNPIIQKDVINLKPFWTSWQLWVYKKWIESQITMCAGDPEHKAFHYYNCSESGILGVLAKSMEKKDFDDKSNWYLMDQVIPKRWHTTRLRNAVGSFLKARDVWERTKESQQVKVQEGRVVTPSGAEVAELSRVRMDTANDAVLQS